MSSFRNNQYIIVKKLTDNFKELNDLSNLDSNRKFLIHVKSSMEEYVDASNDDSYLKYSWDKDTERFSVLSKKNKINFQVWYANIEYQKRKQYNDQENGLLPKDQRVDSDNIPVIFFEKDNRIYVCMLTKKDIQLDRISMLLGGNNLSSEAVNSINITEHFIEWLFWRFISGKEALSNDISINGINSFEGNILEGDDNDSLAGKSIQVPSLNITKTILALSDPLNSANLDFKWGDSALSFLYSIDGFTSVDVRSTYLDDNIKGKIDTQYVKYFQKLVFIIGHVIPKLQTMFISDRQNFLQSFDDFKKEQAKVVIEKLKEVNNL